MVNREISSFTLGVKKEKIPELKNRIDDFRKDILKMVTEETDPEEVVFLNLQFYPVTKALGKRTGNNHL
jgi:uncharacterized protein (TIGR02147 family)